MVDPTPLKTASEKSVWAGWSSVRLRGPQRCSHTGRFACSKMLGLSWQGAETGRLRTRVSRQAVRSSLLSGFQALGMETADRRQKAKQNFSTSGLHVQRPHMLPAFPLSFFVRECFVLSKANFQQCGYFRRFFQVLVLISQVI